MFVMHFLQILNSIRIKSPLKCNLFRVDEFKMRKQTNKHVQLFESKSILGNGIVIQESFIIQGSSFFGSLFLKPVIVRTYDDKKKNIFHYEENPSCLVFKLDSVVRTEVLTTLLN